MEFAMSQFKVGDHVIVVNHKNFSWDKEQIGLTGTVIQVRTNTYLKIQIKYDSPHGRFTPTNSYKPEDLEHSIIHNSPLYQALK